jgi:hypothetical protein
MKLRTNAACACSALFLLGILLLSSCSTSGTRVTTAEYPFLRNADRQDCVMWRKMTGPDFEVFYGRPKTNKTAYFGFYRGGQPNSRPIYGSRIVHGRLGAFPLEWQESTLPRGHGLYRSAVFDRGTRNIKLNHNREVRFTEKIHVWVSGSSEDEVERWIEYLGGLELFKAKPEETIEIR